LNSSLFCSYDLDYKKNLRGMAEQWNGKIELHSKKHLSLNPLSPVLEANVT
jgi:hypothetical protein